MQKTIADLIITTCLILFVTLLGMVGFGFMVAGLHMLLAVHLPGWAAALLTGSAMLLLAVLLLLLFRLARNSEARAARETPASRPQGQTGQDSSRNAALFELAIEMAGKSGFSARDGTLVALIAGTVIGASPALRRQLMALFTETKDEQTDSQD